jgi:hypothetical protein
MVQSPFGEASIVKALKTFPTLCGAKIFTIARRRSLKLDLILKQKTIKTSLIQV